MTAAALIWCPFADEESAARVAGQLLDEGLIACANILGSMRSLYVWRGARSEATESGVLFKTEASLLDRAIERLEELHPYDTPVAVGWRADRTNPAALAWLASLKGAENSR